MQFKPLNAQDLENVTGGWGASIPWHLIDPSVDRDLVLREFFKVAGNAGGGQYLSANGGFPLLFSNNVAPGR